MQRRKSYHLFISHSWSHSDRYKRLLELLDAKPYFFYKDYSVPKDDPVHTTGSTAQLKAAIRRHMAPASVVLVFAGLESTYSKWINIELDMAKGFNPSKKIIGIKPYGAKRISTTVQQAADRIVAWNTNSIVAAIRELSP